MLVSGHFFVSSGPERLSAASGASKCLGGLAHMISASRFLRTDNIEAFVD